MMMKILIIGNLFPLSPRRQAQKPAKGRDMISCTCTRVHIWARVHQCVNAKKMRWSQGNLFFCWPSKMFSALWLATGYWNWKDVWPCKEDTSCFFSEGNVLWFSWMMLLTHMIVVLNFWQKNICRVWQRESIRGKRQVSTTQAYLGLSHYIQNIHVRGYSHRALF